MSGAWGAAVKQRWKIVLEIEVFASRKKDTWGLPGGPAGKESACNAGNPGSIPGLGRSPGEVIGYPLQYSWASPVAQVVKNRPTMWETWVGKIRWRRAGQPTPVFLPGESPWTEGPGGVQPRGSQRVGHDGATKPSTGRKTEDICNRK